VQFDAIQRIAFEVEAVARAHVGQICSDVAAVVLEQQAVPLAQFVVVQVQAGVVREMWRTEQLALGRVGPAVQRADDVAPRMALALRLQVAAFLEHHGLAMAADVGNQFDLTLDIAHQCPALFFLGQGVVVARIGHGELMPHIAGALIEEGFEFTLEQRLIEVAGNW